MPPSGGMQIFRPLSEWDEGLDANGFDLPSWEAERASTPVLELTVLFSLDLKRPISGLNRAGSAATNV